MSKIIIENKNNRIKVINKLSYPENVNERVYNAILSGMFEGFVPVYVFQKRKEIRIECVVQGYIPLAQYFDGLVTKKMFLDFVHEIALQIKECEKNMINANNLDLQSNLIFIDPYTKSVKCIFWPIVNNQRDNPPQAFLKQLPYQFKFSPYEEKEYLKTYSSFFNGINPFSVNAFDKMVLKLAGKPTQAPKRSTPSEALNSASTGETSQENTAKKPISIEYDPFANNNVETKKEKVTEINGEKEVKREVKQEAERIINIEIKKEVEKKMEREIKQQPEHIFCGECGAKNQYNFKFCTQCGAVLKKFEIIDEKPPVQELEIPEVPKVSEAFKFGTVDLASTDLLGDEGGTVVLGSEAEPVYPTLTRIGTAEEYTIDKPSFRIGTEQKYCDLFICDNTYISRSHADIITKDDRYYIVDRNSTNKTYIDGKVIPAEQEIEIFSGTQIRLANEDFSFDIKE